MSTAIWQQDRGRWRLLAPTPYTQENTLHSRVEEAPQILPLSGNPEMVLLGREVPVGSGKRADLLAVERNGRLVVIEIKLAANPESRRAIIAQVLTYAAFLHGLSVDALESNILQPHLAKQGHATIADVVAASDQTGQFDRIGFDEGLRSSLSEGRFRLVLVLDEVPDELVQLAGYLSLIADRVLLDLITVSVYDINGALILVPQRVDPEHSPRSVAVAVPTSSAVQSPVLGTEEFEKAITAAKHDHQPMLNKLLDWARQLEAVNVARLYNLRGITRVTLLPRVAGDNGGLVSVVADSAGPALWFFRSVFERRAPESIERIEALLGDSLRQGNSTRAITDELLEAVTKAYREAASGTITPGAAELA